MYGQSYVSSRVSPFQQRLTRSPRDRRVCALSSVLNSGVLIRTARCPRCSEPSQPQLVILSGMLPACRVESYGYASRQIAMTWVVSSHHKEHDPPRTAWITIPDASDRGHRPSVYNRLVYKALTLACTSPLSSGFFTALASTVLHGTPVQEKVSFIAIVIKPQDT